MNLSIRFQKDPLLKFSAALALLFLTGTGRLSAADPAALKTEYAALANNYNLPVEKQTVFPELSEKAAALQTQIQDAQKICDSFVKALSDGQDARQKLDILKSPTTPKADRFQGWRYTCSCHPTDRKVYDFAAMKKRRRKCRIELVPKMTDQEWRDASEKVNKQIADATTGKLDSASKLEKLNVEYRRMKMDFQNRCGERAKAILAELKKTAPAQTK